jgi:hypothetical protein
VNALNQLEIACQRTARKMVDVPHSSGAGTAGLISWQTPRSSRRLAGCSGATTQP